MKEGSEIVRQFLVDFKVMLKNSYHKVKQSKIRQSSNSLSTIKLLEKELILPHISRLQIFVAFKIIGVDIQRVKSCLIIPHAGIIAPYFLENVLMPEANKTTDLIREIKKKIDAATDRAIKLGLRR